MVDPVDHQFLDPSVLVEEETVRGYKAEHYYPVRIGEVFQDRYRVIGKLGYGTASTVWLCKDLSGQHEYIALKVYINRSKVHRELPIYKHINSLNSQHDGRDYVRKLIDSFELSGPDGEHTCLVHEASGMNMEELRDLVPRGAMNGYLVRQFLRPVLRGMRFLHEDAHVIHTGQPRLRTRCCALLTVERADIQPKNILLGVLDTSAFTRYEEDEHKYPMPRKELPSRTVYTSKPMLFTKGAPSLADLSEARFENPENVDFVMPDLYRAPEVVLGMPWSYPIDTWGFAMTMISIMGPPPLGYLQRSEKSKLFWDDEGEWKGDVPIPETTLELAEARLQGEEKDLFLTFMRKMLQWKPEDRKNLEEVFMDEWLLADLIEAGVVTCD
ncbi:hypothetical protein LTR02_002537 [Friedmanniomyces endolithicus]|nr:hypothetical protein LTS09_011608 [Friedmanniomyces endolithicus]KAK0355602.1 hypothetical protein LTR94_007797 [Friedmanniomyces endolithicus]KAK0793075.1 hypothetical protein LTR59_008244 [Friedmanniomyces endolithicus]KAK0800410.1 hypothetical protein LTR38_007248 [Friedmanniomyces endolithicus]KAK0806108.1 hypothetical protein LTR75_007073 [Friedmanniomyces endolithicus]